MAVSSRGSIRSKDRCGAISGRGGTDFEAINNKSPMALLPPFFLDTVVAVGFGDDPATRKWIGTGFLYGNVVLSKPPFNPTRYRVWLITNKHVLQNLPAIYVKFNS